MGEISWYSGEILIWHLGRKCCEEVSSSHQWAESQSFCLVLAQPNAHSTLLDFSSELASAQRLRIMIKLTPPPPQKKKKLQTIQFVKCHLWTSWLWHPICLRLLSHWSWLIFLYVPWHPAPKLSSCASQVTAFARGSADWHKRGSNYPSHTVTFLLEGQLIRLSLHCYFPGICRNIISWRSVALSS